MDDDVAGNVRFRADDQRAAVDYLLATAESADPKRVQGTWVSITPADPPPEALPEKKNWLGRAKRGQPPQLDVIFFAPGADAPHTGTLSSDGPEILSTLRDGGVEVPATWSIDDSGTSIMFEAPPDTGADEVVAFAVQSLTALLGGVGTQFDASIQG